MARIVDEFTDPIEPVEDDDPLVYSPVISIAVPGFQGPASTIPGPKGDKGDQGDRGDKGESVLATAEYLEVSFNIPSDVWYVPHDFINPHPDVTVIYQGQKVEADVFYETPNLVRIEFAHEMTGVVQLG